jgi:hypothetical protein
VSTGTRRVRRVRLAAPRPELVRRGAVLLEDALHTASIPGGAGGRLVLVRKLDVGRIHPHAPPSTLALAIEARLREVELTAIHADDEAAPTASAVWFRDAAEAYALLAVRLATGRGADAWFWASAVPGWRAGMAADDGIRLAMHAAAESVQGAAAVAEVLRLAARRGAADRIVSATLTTYAAAVLRTLGWTAAVPVDGDRAEPVPSEWRPLLKRWIGTWGADDVRSTWLAATVLIAERPSRAADRTLPQRAAALVRAVDVATLSASRETQPDATPESIHIPRRESTDPPAAPANRAEFADKVAVPESTAVRLDEASEPPVRRRAEAVDAVEEIRKRPSSNELEEAGQGDVDRVAPRMDEARVHHSHPQEAENAVETAKVWHGEDAKSAIDLIAPIIESEEDTAPSARRVEERPRRRRAESDGAEPTEAGGLFFLVNAMQRLGMAEVLDRHPGLLEADLPGRVLLRIAERTRVPADDPALACLADARDAGETAARYPFESPAVWARGIAREGEATDHVEAGRTLTFDASGRLLLALRPAETDTFALSHSRTLALAADLDLITDAWTTALRRWCRRYARMGLHDVVRRRGRMAFTRTHVDVTLALRGADVRARAAGLDLDPGWVPWLGRVIAFHYTD